jgi:hypothetical protein
VGSIDPKREPIRGIQRWKTPHACAELASRKPSWPAVLCDRIKQAGHMDASDSIYCLPQKLIAREGAVHIWIPAFALGHAHISEGLDLGPQTESNSPHLRDY